MDVCTECWKGRRHLFYLYRSWDRRLLVQARFFSLINSQYLLYNDIWVIKYTLMIGRSPLQAELSTILAYWGQKCVLAWPRHVFIWVNLARGNIDFIVCFSGDAECECLFLLNRCGRIIVLEVRLESVWVRAWCVNYIYTYINELLLLLFFSKSKRSPIPKLGALLPNVRGNSYYSCSLMTFFKWGNLSPLPNENFCLAVEKLATSF